VRKQKGKRVEKWREKRRINKSKEMKKNIRKEAQMKMSY